MENAIIVPFDLNTARKIKSGEIEGSVLIDNIERTYKNVNAAQSLSDLIMVLRIACFEKHLKNWIWILVMPHGFTSSAAAATTASTIGE